MKLELDSQKTVSAAGKLIVWLGKLAVAGVKAVSRPGIGLAAIALFLGYFVGAGTRIELFDQALHIAGIGLVSLIPVLILLVGCYFIFDFFLSFQEFTTKIGKWYRGEWKPGPEDTMIMLSMGVRSGLVFIGMAIVFDASMAFVLKHVKYVAGG